MYKKEDLKRQLRAMGVQSGDTVVIHISLKAVGEVEGGGETVLDALIESVGDGLLIVPTHTWANVNKNQPIYDRSSTPSCLGVLPNLALGRGDGVRSLHPTHSVKAFGPRAEAYVSGEERCTTPTPQEGCWGRLLEEKAKILLIGVGQERNTFLHAVEEMLDIPQRLNQEPMELTIQDRGRVIASVQMHGHKNPYVEHLSECFVKLEEPFRLAGAVSGGQFGDAPVQVCLAEECSREMSRLWALAAGQGLNLTDNFDPVPREWYEGMV